MRCTNAQLAKNPMEPGSTISNSTKMHREKEGNIHTGHDKHNESNQGRITNIQNCPREPTKADSSRPEEERVEENITTCHTGSGKCAPVPSVILGAEQEIHEQHGRGGRGDDHQTIADEQEAEHVVDLVGPERGHDEIEFHENGSKGKKTGQKHRWDRAQGAGHGGNLTGNLVGLGGTFDCLETGVSQQFNSTDNRRERRNLPVA